MALFPIQNKYYQELQNGPESHRKDCGVPGVNGGYFKDKTMKLGVNCYGYKPKADPSKIKYVTQQQNSKSNGTINNSYQLDSLNQELDKVKKIIKKEDVTPLPWNQNQWSDGSKVSKDIIITQNNVTSTLPDDMIPDNEDDSEDNYIQGQGQGQGQTNCSYSQFGCCPDNNTPKIDEYGSNCQYNDNDNDNDDYILIEETEI